MGELGIGDQIGRYRLEEFIGRGGLGIVYRARRDDGAVVAVKLMRAHLANDAMFIKRFAREARHAGTIHHPHLVPVLESGQAADIHPYIVMPYIEGGTLADRIADKGVLELSETVLVTGQIAAALAALHAVDLVHRDVKPANVLLSERGAMVTDFGLARSRADTVLTRMGVAPGTPSYMAPEVLMGQPATAASDTYALACVAYTCLAGEPPYTGEPLRARTQGPPTAPARWRSDVPTDAGSAVLSGLQLDPSARPRTPIAFASMLAVAARS
jgi:eukaryotic-like serine/threonine-protein kinase